MQLKKNDGWEDGRMRLKAVVPLAIVRHKCVILVGKTKREDIQPTSTPSSYPWERKSEKQDCYDS
jgi:hypothetical protein